MLDQSVDRSIDRSIKQDKTLKAEIATSNWKIAMLCSDAYDLSCKNRIYTPFVARHSICLSVWRNAHIVLLLVEFLELASEKMVEDRVSTV